MVRFAAAVAVLIMAAGLGVAQVQPTRVMSYPQVPSKEALKRLDLNLGWKAFLAVEDTRDGFATVQVWGDRLYVQMRNGTVFSVDAETGRVLWRARFGIPYRVTQPVGINLDTVFVINVTRLYALDRASGRLKYEMNLPNVPITPPVADSQRVYLTLAGNTLLVYGLPDPELDQLPPPVPPPPKVEPVPLPSQQQFVPRKSALGTYYGTESHVLTPLTSSSKPPAITYTPLASMTKATLGLAGGFQLPLVWQYLADSRLEITPLVTLRSVDQPGFILLASARGVIYGSSKAQRALLYSFQREAPVSTQPAQYGEIAYIPYEDSTIQAMHIETGRILWRLSVGAAPHQPLVANDEDLYLVTERDGLHRISRATGELLWKNPRAERFVAANRLIVYALDARGELLLLDRARGIVLTALDTRDYTFPIVNPFTDRVYLAAHNGLLISLHDIHYPGPAFNKQLIEEPRPQRRRLPEKEAP